MVPFTGTVAVTGLNATDNPGPGLAVVRALRADPRFQGRIIGLAYDAMDPGLYTPNVLDGAMLIPYPSAGREALLARLAWCQQRFGLDVLIPTLDSELPALCDQEPLLESMGIRTFLPTRAQYDMRSKARLDELTAHGVPVPKAIPISDPSTLYTIHEELGGFPLVVKGVFYGATIAWNVSEAIAGFHKQAAEWGLPVIVQEHVSGEELNVCVVGDGDGGIVGAVPMKKLMLTKSGKGWAGVTIDDPGLMEMAASTIAALKWRGPCELEVMRDDRGGFHLMEINPRFPAWCDLSAGAGHNLPMAYVDLAMDRTPHLPDYRVGTAFVRVSINQIVDVAAFEGLSTVGETASLTSDDLPEGGDMPSPTTIRPLH